MDIRRVENVTPDQFYNQYFLPEIPVIIKSVTDDWEAKNTWNFKYLKNKMVNIERTDKVLWNEFAPGTFGTDFTLPEIVSTCLKSPLVSHQTNNERLWMNPKGNQTFLHYDNNSSFVFNVQVRGEKKCSPSY